MLARRRKQGGERDDDEPRESGGSEHSQHWTPPQMRFDTGAFGRFRTEV